MANKSKVEFEGLPSGLEGSNHTEVLFGCSFVVFVAYIFVSLSPQYFEKGTVN